MRFFKYLIPFFILLSSSAYSAIVYYVSGEKSNTTASSYQASCSMLSTYYDRVLSDSGEYSYSVHSSTSTNCTLKRSDGGFLYHQILTTNQSECPESGMPLVTYFTANTPAPTQVCKENSD
ncbi:MAG: hypothetical protein RSE19_13850, partial [Myroides sp.]